MRILLLTPQLPYPAHQGAAIRNDSILRGLGGRHEVALLSFRGAEDQEALRHLSDYCRHIQTVPISPWTGLKRLRSLLLSGRPDLALRLATPAFRAALRKMQATAGPFDIVQIEGLELAGNLGHIRLAAPHCRIVLDSHNAETTLQARALRHDLGRPRRWPAALYSAIQVWRLAQFERWACRKADWVTAVSQADAEALRRLAAIDRLSVIPNCLDVASYRPELFPNPPRFDLVFSGKMDYRPNVDAALWFHATVWPQIRRARPDARWAVVGQRPHTRLRPLKDSPGVVVTGRVEDVRPYLAGAGVYILPIRYGGGSRLKLLEAMAMGKAIVTTSAGAEGFDVRAGRDLWLADAADEFAAAVGRLLGDPVERRRLGEGGGAFARQYDWRRVIPRFDEVYRRLKPTT
ncbi:MAG: glycosyltransferase [Candidatus Promineifilaceae bacterium]